VLHGRCLLPSGLPLGLSRRGLHPFGCCGGGRTEPANSFMLGSRERCPGIKPLSCGGAESGRSDSFVLGSAKRRTGAVDRRGLSPKWRSGGAVGGIDGETVRSDGGHGTFEAGRVMWNHDATDQWGVTKRLICMAGLERFGVARVVRLDLRPTIQGRGTGGYPFLNFRTRKSHSPTEPQGGRAEATGIPQDMNVRG
jgi:hypothetical protein